MPVQPIVRLGRRLVSGALVLALALALAAIVQLWRAPAAWGQVLDLRPPSPVVRQIHGQGLAAPASFAAEQASQDLRLIYVWATWCGACRYSRPAVNRLAETWETTTVAVWSGHATSVQAHLQKAALAGAAWVDPEGELAQRWGVSAVPTVFVLNSSNQVVWASTGLVSSWQLAAGSWLGQRLLDWGLLGRSERT